MSTVTSHYCDVCQDAALELVVKLGEAFVRQINFNGPAIRPELGPCWIWQGSHNNDGYGVLTVKRKQVPAHVYLFTRMGGVIPKDWEVDHLCRVRDCIRFEHLEAVTAQVNVWRSDSPCGLNHRKTHCVNGHEFNEANTGYRENGHRWCRVCARELSAVARSVRPLVTFKLTCGHCGTAFERQGKFNQYSPAYLKRYRPTCSRSCQASLAWASKKEKYVA